MFNKEKFLIGLSILLFVSSMLYLTYLGLSWNQEANQEGAAVEINLPIISWEKYLNLSKQPE